MTESVRFDRAAAHYDTTRAISDEGMARTIELLASELLGRGRALEVGVGTGLLALPMHEAGVNTWKSGFYPLQRGWVPTVTG